MTMLVLKISLVVDAFTKVCPEKRERLKTIIPEACGFQDVIHGFQLFFVSDWLDEFHNKFPPPECILTNYFIRYVTFMETV